MDVVQDEDGGVPAGGHQVGALLRRHRVRAQLRHRPRAQLPALQTASMLEFKFKSRTVTA